MSAFSPCAQARAKLIDLAARRLADDERQALTQHLAVCGDCRVAAGNIERSVAALRNDEPPVAAPALRRAQIATALAGGQTTAPAWQGRWALVFASMAAAAAVGIFFAVRQSAIPEPRVALLSGQVASGGVRLVVGDSHILTGQTVQLDAATDAAVQLSDGSRVALARDTHLGVEYARGYRLHLGGGRVDCLVRKQQGGRHFAVSTPEADIVVLGTRFGVTTAPLAGTRVTVVSGVVEVTARRAGLKKRLSAGEEWELAAETMPASSLDAASVNLSQADASQPGRSSSNTGVVTQIRAEIKAGHVDAAHKLIKRARGRGRAESGVAELAMVEAEAYLAERQFDRAIATYLDVVEKYPRTEQAETALFAAAQVASDHATPYDGMKLLQRYQHEFPKGRFRTEALRALHPAK